MKRSKIRVRVQTHIEQDGEGFHGYAPALRGCHVGGETAEETRKNLDDAIVLYLTALMERGLPLPIGCTPEIVDEHRRFKNTLSLAGIEEDQPVSSNEEADISIPVPA